MYVLSQFLEKMAEKAMGQGQGQGGPPAGYPRPEEVRFFGTEVICAVSVLLLRAALIAVPEEHLYHASTAVPEQGYGGQPGYGGGGMGGGQPGYGQPQQVWALTLCKEL